jgi:hypothetical protein
MALKFLSPYPYYRKALVSTIISRHHLKKTYAFLINPMSNLSPIPTRFPTPCPDRSIRHGIASSGPRRSGV